MAELFANSFAVFFLTTFRPNFNDNYSLTTNKYTTDSWYCSKLVWQPYYTIANSDFDRGGGYYVLPVDLFLAGYYQHNGANLYYYYIR